MAGPASWHSPPGKPGLRLYKYEPRDGWPECWGIATHFGWLPGLYDTAETAVYADRLSTSVLEELCDEINKPPVSRPITLDDLKAREVS